MIWGHHAPPIARVPLVRRDGAGHSNLLRPTHPIHPDGKRAITDPTGQQSLGEGAARARAIG